MGGQSLCPVSRGLLYSTFPAMQGAPTSGEEPRKMMWVFSQTIQVVFLLTVAFEVPASENSAWRKRAGVCLHALSVGSGWDTEIQPGAAFIPRQSVMIQTKHHQNIWTCRKFFTLTLSPQRSKRNKAPWKQRQLDSLRNNVFFGNGVPTLKRIATALWPTAFLSPLYFSHWKPPVSPS